jgi:hypothetical protein
VGIPHSIVPERISFRGGPIDFLALVLLDRAACAVSTLFGDSRNGTFESFYRDAQQQCIDMFDVPIPRFA